jgi:hypothetical protein
MIRQGGIMVQGHQRVEVSSMPVEGSPHGEYGEVTLVASVDYKSIQGRHLFIKNLCVNAI